MTVAPDLTGTVKYTNVNPSYGNTLEFVDHPLDVYNEVECPSVDPDHRYADAAITNLRTDCELFWKFDTDKFGCIKCKHGKVGHNINYTEDATSDVFTLGTCVDLNACDSTKYKNVNPFWN